MSRQREYLADARAVQWTRSKDGLGGVLRKVMGQRQAASYDPRRGQYALNHHAVQHMLLVDVQGSSRWAERLATHPALPERVRRIYGRPMPAMALQKREI
ncbi:heat shock protein HtpX [compost metagenome]